MKKWVSVEEAVVLVRRSQHTVYNWIYKSRQGTTSYPLTLKRVPAPGSGKSNAWLIESRSLMEADKLSPRVRRKEKEKQHKVEGKKSIRWDGGDNPQRMRADRRERTS